MSFNKYKRQERPGASTPGLLFFFTGKIYNKTENYYSKQAQAGNPEKKIEVFSGCHGRYKKEQAGQDGKKQDFTGEGV